MIKIKAEAAVTLPKNKKIAILALTPILNLTQTLTLTIIKKQKRVDEQMSTHSLLSYSL